MSVKVYILGFLIAGSPALGLEALLLGLGGEFKNYFEEKIKIFQYALPIGLTIVATSIGISYLLELDSLYLIVLTLALTFCTGGIASLIPRETKKEPPKEETVTDNEIETMLENRGLDSLINKEETKSPEKLIEKSEEENKKE